MHELDIVVNTAYKAYKAAAKKTKAAAAHKALENSATPATTVLIAAIHLLGPIEEFKTWEPETLWLTLGDVAIINRDKLLAAIALDVTPSFYWDYRVMGNTVLAFNNIAVGVRNIPAPTPEQLAWGVWEAELIYALTETGDVEAPELDDEPAAYTAALLHDAGFAKAPEFLFFAEEKLKELINDVEPDAEVQKDNQKRVDEYLAEQSKILIDSLKAFT